MAVGIGRSIREGFRAANKSWAGIGVVIGVWIVLAIIGLVGIGLTNPPAGLGEQAGIPVADLPSPPPATTADVAPAPAEEATLFTELETAEDAAPAAPEAAPPPAGGGAGGRTAQDTEQEEQIRLVREWFGRAWPVLLVGVLLYVAVGTWLWGGQIGYLAQRVTTQQSSLSQFWTAGARAFWPILGASLLMLLAVGGLALVAAAGAQFTAAVPGWLLAILVVLLWIALVWVAIRLAFWLIAIVVDRVGPIGGFRASLRATRGHWWRLFGLVVLWVLIGVGIQVPLGLLQEWGNVTGGALALVTGLISTVVGGIANVYLSFASLAAFIRFYEDAKAATVSMGGPA